MDISKNYKIIVSHPHKQHSFQTAIAIKRRGMLHKYITTVYDSGNSLTSNIKKMLNGSALKKAQGRRCSELQEVEVKQFYEFGRLIFLATIRFPKLLNIAISWDHIISYFFGKKVAQYAINSEVDAVISYDRFSADCFNLLKNDSPQIKRIMDISIVTTAYMKNTFENDMKCTGLRELKSENAFLWNEKVMGKYMQEIKSTDYFFAPSNVVKSSLIYCGVSEDRIKIIPYGVNVDKFSFSMKTVSEGPLKLLFVGQVNFRKGIHHLINVLRRFNKDVIDLTIIGSYDKTGYIYNEAVDMINVHFEGFVTPELLSERYRDADVFILPSLGEGMALVGLEALSTGTPLICSDETGVNDVIVNGYNGFVYNSGDNYELENIINWFLNNRDKLPEMSIKARETAERYSWNKYYEKVGNAIDEIMKG